MSRQKGNEAQRQLGAKADGPAPPVAQSRETRRYKTRRRLIVPGAGDFPRGAVCELTAEQHAANRNSLIAVDRPADDEPDSGKAAPPAGAGDQADAEGGADDGG